MNQSHDLGRPFKVVITISPSSTFSSTTSSFFLDLINPCEVGLHSLWVLYIHILQLVPQCHLLIDVLSFEHLCQSIKYFLRCPEGWHMGDEVILNRFCNDSLVLNQVLLMSRISLISLWIWNFSIDVLIQIIFFKDQGYFVLPCLELINPSKLVLKLSMVIHIFKWEPQMEIESI